MKRQLPKRHDLAPLLQFKRPDARRRSSAGSAAALTIEDLRRIAKRRTPKAAFDYTDGAADGEVSLARARQAFADVRVQPGDPARRLEGRHLAGGAGRAGRAAVRHRADRVHPDDARPRARSPARPRRPRPGIPFALSTMGTTSIEDVAAAAPGGRQLVPALHVEGPRPVDGAGRAGGEGRLRHAAGHRRRAGRRRPAARRAQRHDDPADADPAHDRQRDPAAGVVVQLPHHRAARLRLARRVVGHGRRAAGHDVRPDGHLRRPGLDPRPVARPGRRSRACRPSTTPAGCADVGVDAVVLSNHGGRQLDRAPGAVPPAARGGRPRSAATSRCTSTPASCPARTSSPRSPTAPASP